MNAQLMSGLVTILVAVIGVSGVYFANRFQKGTRENKMIDQLQEQLKTVQNRMDEFEARDRIYIPHILQLNWHIETGKGPPAPPIPRVILDFINPPEKP